jgi:amidase
MARYVEDLALALPLICGPDGEDPYAVPVSLGEPQAIDPASLRIAWHDDNGVVSPHADIRRVVAETAHALSDDGLRIEPGMLPETRQLIDLTTEFREMTNAGYISRLLKRHGTTQTGRQLEGYLTEQGLANANYVDPALIEEIDAARARALRWFADYDAILCPVSFAIARPHGASHGDSFDEWGYMQIYNLLGWPGLSVRAGSSADGMPVGVQVVAPPWREDIALAIGLRIESLMGGFLPPAI